MKTGGMSKLLNTKLLLRPRASGFLMLTTSLQASFLEIVWRWHKLLILCSNIPLWCLLPDARAQHTFNLYLRKMLNVELLGS